MFSDEDLMVVALSEATKISVRTTLPNPRVGAAIFTTNEKLYFGHHARAGDDHAEVRAIKSAQASGADLRGATVAVNLEPCAHHGKTPPCADALVAAGVARVLVGTVDPDPRVSGRGIARLRAAGIEVIEGVLEADCVATNKEWLHGKRTGLPYIYLKMATSLDGLWTSDSGDSKWITGATARVHAHQLRTQVGCLVSTLKTVLHDDAMLSARDGQGELLPVQPDLAVVSRQSEWGAAWASGNLAAQQVTGRRILEWRSESVRDLLAKLYEDGHVGVLIEAGPEFSSVCLAQGLVQEIWHYQGACYLGGSGKRLAPLEGGKLPGLVIKNCEVTHLDGGDLVIKSKLT